MQTTLVIGHLRPDLDSIGSAVAYAELLRQRDQPAEAGRAGPLDEQSQWALERFEIDPPQLVRDVAPTFGTIVRDLPPCGASFTLAEVMAAIAHGARAVAFVDEARRALGLLDPRACVHLLGQALAGSENEASEAAVERALRRSQEPALPPVGLPKGIEEPITFNANERLSDRRSKVIAVDADDFLVVDDDGVYLGIAARSDALAPPRRRLVLVDHNELSQAVAGANEAEIVEVLDHHRLGNPATIVPIPFVVDPVGSTATLVSEQWQGATVTLTGPLAGLLLAAIMSDTAAFRSPTTTHRDRQAAARLASLCNVADPEVFGVEVVAAGAGLGQRSGDEIVGEDYKEYSISMGNLLVSQAEVRNVHEISPRIDDLRQALAKLQERRSAVLAVLMLTDPVRGNSRLMAVGDTRLIARLPYATAADGLMEAPGVVSRKKQLIPSVLAGVEG